MRNVSIIHPLAFCASIPKRADALSCRPYFFKLKLASLFKLYCRHHDVGVPFFAAAMTRLSTAPQKNSCPRFGADGNREIIPNVTRARIYSSVLPGLDHPSQAATTTCSSSPFSSCMGTVGVVRGLPVLLKCSRPTGTQQAPRPAHHGQPSLL